MSDRAFPIITVREIPTARSFYEKLGFTQAYQFPADGEPVFVTMERGSSSIGIGAGQEDGSDRYGYWVYVDDVDTALATLTAAGAPVVEEPADQPWGERVAQTRDPDGNLVYLGARTTDTQVRRGVPDRDEGP
jgi:lactoylglutathione lyase